MTAPADSELACRELVERVTDWLEGALAYGDRARFELHLERCAACVTYVEQLRETVRLARRLGRQLDAAAPSPATRAALLAAFRRFRSRQGGAA